VQLEISQVRRPDECGQIVSETIVHDPLIAFAPHLCCLYPFWPMRGAVLLIEKLTFHAIWITLHCKGTILQMRQKRRRNADVVIDHLRLGETGPRVKHLVQVRYLKFSIVDDEFRLLGHQSNLAQRPRRTQSF
jgi:hypothetical protein